MNVGTLAGLSDPVDYIPVSTSRTEVLNPNMLVSAG